MATWKRELDVIECLSCDDFTIRQAWRQYITADGGEIEGFAKFIEAWAAQGKDYFARLRVRLKCPHGG